MSSTYMKYTLQTSKKRTVLYKLQNYTKLMYTSPGLNAYIANVINLLHNKHNKNTACYTLLNHTTRSCITFWSIST